MGNGNGQTLSPSADNFQVIAVANIEQLCGALTDLRETVHDALGAFELGRIKTQQLCQAIDIIGGQGRLECVHRSGGIGKLWRPCRPYTARSPSSAAARTGE